MRTEADPIGPPGAHAGALTGRQSARSSWMARDPAWGHVGKIVLVSLASDDGAAAVSPLHTVVRPRLNRRGYRRARHRPIRVRRRARRWTCAAGCRRVAPQRCPGVQASGRAVGTAHCQRAERDTTLALARLRLARRGATACLAAGRLRIACTNPAARAVNLIIWGDDHGQSLAHLADHACDRALRPARPGAAQGGATRAGRAPGEFHCRTGTCSSPSRAPAT